MGMVAKEFLEYFPDEAIRHHMSMEIDKIMKHLPDCPDQVSIYQKVIFHFFPSLSEIKKKVSQLRRN
jgi:hypothetical protein